MYEPTSEQCSSNAIIEEDGTRFLACWYPQMGGYIGKCLVKHTGNKCFEAFVWHDGEFPFSGPHPIEMHHCSADQFVHFGEVVKKFQEEQHLNRIREESLAKMDLARQRRPVGGANESAGASVWVKP